MKQLDNTTKGKLAFVEAYGTHFVTGMQMGGVSTFTLKTSGAVLSNLTRAKCNVGEATTLYSIKNQYHGDITSDPHYPDYLELSKALPSSTTSSCAGKPECAPAW